MKRPHGVLLRILLESVRGASEVTACELLRNSRPLRLTIPRSSRKARI